MAKSVTYKTPDLVALQQIQRLKIASCGRNFRFFPGGTYCHCTLSTHKLMVTRGWKSKLSWGETRMRRLLVVSGLVLGTVMLVAGCGGGGAKAPPPPNADKIQMDMNNPGATLPPPPGTPGIPAKR